MHLVNDKRYYWSSCRAKILCYPGKPKASSSGDYLVLQKEKLKTLKTQEQKKVFLYVSCKDIYNASS